MVMMVITITYFTFKINIIIIILIKISVNLWAESVGDFTLGFTLVLFWKFMTNVTSS